MLVKNNDRKAAYDALINLALKDSRIYCNNCGVEHPQKIHIIPCCENPQVGDNLDHTRAIIKQVKEIKESRKNEFACNDSKTMRWGVSLPVWLYQALDRYEETHGEGRRLFKTNDDIVWFARKYPQFAIPKKV